MSVAAPGSAPEEIVLPAAIGLETTVEIAGQLRDAGPAAAVCLDAAAVEQMSTAFVLTLAAAVAERAEGMPKLQVRNPSAVFTDAFTDLGLFTDLMKMEFAT